MHNTLGESGKPVIILRFGFCLPHDGPLSAPFNMTELSRHAERIGFDTLVEPSDHIVMPEKISTTYPYSSSGKYTDTPEDLDQLTTLSFVAAKTEEIRVMTGISVIPYRNPLALANAFATVDYLSDGRLDIGAGVGWMKEEFDLLRVPFLERGEIMDESIKILKIIWSEKNPEFSGKYFRFKDAHFSPKVVQKPHPPIWIGGESPRALRRAAELGDGWLPIDNNETFPLLTLEQMSNAIGRLRARIVKAGRKVEDVQVGYVPQILEMSDHPSSTGLLSGDTGTIAKNVGELEELGVSFIALSFLRENLDKTKDYSKKFAEEVIDRL